jgi:hypothetical protein
VDWTVLPKLDIKRIKRDYGKAWIDSGKSIRKRGKFFLPKDTEESIPPETKQTTRPFT